MSNQFISTDQNTTQFLDADDGGLVLTPGTSIIPGTGNPGISTNGFQNTTVLVAGTIVSDVEGIISPNASGFANGTSITISRTGSILSFSDAFQETAVEMSGSNMRLQNDGEIIGSRGINANGEIDILNTGSITATDGVSGIGAIIQNSSGANLTSTLNNTGTIAASDVIGVFSFDSDLSVVNSGEIIGGIAGIEFQDASLDTVFSLVNSGLISGSQGLGVDLNTDGSLANSGVISGRQAGVAADNDEGRPNEAVSIANLSGGQITGIGPNATGIASTGFSLSVTNEGSVIGTNQGISFGDDLSGPLGDLTFYLNNSGSVSSDRQAVAVFEAASGEIINSGSLISETETGVLALQGGGTSTPFKLSNTSTGVISGTENTSFGAYVAGYQTVISNDGEILGGAAGLVVEDLADVGGGFLTTQISNTGVIRGTRDGVFVLGDISGIIENDGVISGQGGDGVGLLGALVEGLRIDIVNNENGVISGLGLASFGVVSNGVNLNVINAGTISGESFGVASSFVNELEEVVGTINNAVVNNGTILGGDGAIGLVGQSVVLNTGTMSSLGEATVGLANSALPEDRIQVATFTNAGLITAEGGLVYGEDPGNPNGPEVATSQFGNGVSSIGLNFEGENTGQILARMVGIEFDGVSEVPGASGTIPVEMDFANTGTISAKDKAIDVRNAIQATIFNAGELLATGRTEVPQDMVSTALPAGDGIRFLDVDAVALTNEGSIAGQEHGVLIDTSSTEATGASATLTNAGSISSALSSAVSARATALTLINSGEISNNSIDGSAAVELDVPGGASDTLSLFNTGTISGATTSVEAGDAGNLVDNGGVLQGRVFLGSGFDDVFNSGVVQGNVLVGGGADDVVNTGTVIGDVDLNDGADTYEAAFTGTVSGSVFGGNGTDTMRGGQSTDRFVGGAAADMLGGRGGDDILDGGSGNDILDGGAGNDTLTGGADNDTLKGGAGDDDLQGGDGFDTLRGGSGDDMLDGGSQDDTLFGDDGNDTLNGGNGRDVMSGGDGNDTLNGGGGGDTMDGGRGDDTLNGGDGFDVLSGGSGDDTLTGGEGDDTLDGGAGNDVLTGGVGGDTLLGGAGDDTLDGQNSTDTLNGGAGSDVLIGGGGADTFVFERGNALDTITDFADGTDRIDVSDWGLVDYADLEANYSVTEFGFGVQIAFANDDRLVIENIAQADLSDADFIFV